MVYVDDMSPVILICALHGEYSQTPKIHLRGKHGCKQCANLVSGQYHKKSNEDFIKEAVETHGDKYDYSLVDYKSSHTKVEIVCNDHGSFLQDPMSHVRGSGCPECKKDHLKGGYGELRFKNRPELKDELGELYLIRLTSDTEDFVKVGITKEGMKKRIGGFWEYEVRIIQTVSGPMYELFKAEQHIKSTHKRFKYRPSKNFAGKTECFKLEAQDALLNQLTEEGLFK